MRYSGFFLGALLLAAPLQLHAAGLTYTDDEAEAGGYDVTATYKGGAAEFALAEAENGDGYRLKITQGAMQLDAVVDKKPQRLARVNGSIAPGPLVVQRRGAQFRIISSRRVMLEAEDSRFHEGKIGSGGAVSDLRVQPTGEITFADDFMRDAKAVLVKQAAGSETIWRAVKGSWATSGLTENEQAKVDQTTNPFIFKSTAPDVNLAVAGESFWSDYNAEVSVKPEGAAAFGLAVYVQDEKNYLIMHWEEKGSLQLRAVIDGATRVLDQYGGGFDQYQWYRLRVSATAGMVRAWLDDNEVLRARTGLLGRGGVGLYVKSPAKEGSAVFDDVLVRSEDGLLEDFTKTVPGRWKTLTGAWRMGRGVAPGGVAPGGVSGTGPGAALPQGAAQASAVLGDTDWSDYTQSAAITLPADSSAGLLLHYGEDGQAYVLLVSGSRSGLPYAGKVVIARLPKRASKDQKDVVLSEVRTGARFDGKTTVWSFSAERGYLRASADDALVLDAFDETLTAGKAGIAAQGRGAEKPVIRDFEVVFPQPRATWAKVPDLYTEGPQPITMGGWSTPEGFWLTSSQRTGALVEAGNAKPKPGETLWHKGRFWGEDSVSFALPAIEAGKSLDLMFAAVPAKGGVASADTAMKLAFKLEGDKLSAELIKGKEVLTRGESKLNGAATDHNVQVERRGRFVVVRINGKDETPRTMLAARVR